MKKYILSLVIFTLLFVFGVNSVKAETASCSAFTTTLKMRMNNSQVKCLQEMLNDNGFQVSLTGAGSKGFETNYFGTKTAIALKAFQASQMLSVDGIFGPMSRVSLLNRNGNANFKIGCSSTLGFSTVTGLPCNNANPFDVTVSSPVANAVWMTGNSYNINWTTSPSMNMLPSKVTITLNSPRPACLDSVPACMIAETMPYTIVADLTDTGSYVWTIPQSISENYRGSMQITVTRDAPRQAVGRSAVFSIVESSSSIKFITPSKVGNVWKVGNTYDVSWSIDHSLVSSIVELGLIDIDYNSTASVASSLVWGPVTITNRSPYKFTVPKNLRTGTYRFLLKYGNEYVNSDDFSIVNSNVAPTILFSANPSYILVGNSSTLKWEATNAASCVLGSGAAEVASAGSSIVYPKTTTIFKIVCTGLGGSVSSSATVFVSYYSTSPTMQVSSPEAGNQWYQGKTYTIKWNAVPTISSAAAPTVKITIASPTPTCLNATPPCMMPIAQPYVIAQNAPNNGSYTWTVPSNFTTSVVNAFNNFGNQQITVALNGTDKSGTSDTFSVIKASTYPPIISGVSGPVSLNINQTGTWTVNTFSTVNLGNLSYTVDWDDPYFDLSYPSSSTSSLIQQTATFSHAYSRAGTYTPTFTVTNQSGQSAQTSLSIKVNGVAVVCDYPAPPQGCDYIQGSNYNPNTQCGMVLSCSTTLPPGCTSSVGFSPMTGNSCSN